jgi:hypothetical protein
MAKLLVQHDTDPGIAVILTEVPPRTPGKAQGCHGTCTECGWTIHRWLTENAIKDAREHVDSHESGL